MKATGTGLEPDGGLGFPDTKEEAVRNPELDGIAGAALCPWFALDLRYGLLRALADEALASVIAVLELLADVAAFSVAVENGEVVGTCRFVLLLEAYGLFGAVMGRGDMETLGGCPCCRRAYGF